MSEINLEKYGLSDIIYNYYNGDVYSINKQNIRDNFNKGNIDSDEQHKLKLVLKQYTKNPKLKFKLGEKPPKKSVVITNPKDVENHLKYISFQRKAFIEWINGEFYQNNLYGFEHISFNQRSEHHFDSNFGSLGVQLKYTF